MVKAKKSFLFGGPQGSRNALATAVWSDEKGLHLIKMVGGDPALKSSKKAAKATEAP